MSRRSKIMLAVLFGIKCKEQLLAKPNNAKKVLALLVRAYRNLIALYNAFENISPIKANKLTNNITKL